jgi:acyl-CoA thioesterase II
VRDGRSFIARRVQAIQNGAPILSMIASFQKPEPGLEHQMKMPDVPPPEQLEFAHVLRNQWADAMPGLPDRARQALGRDLAIEFKPVRPWNPLQPEVREPVQHIWLRAAGKLPDDPLLHTCVLAYASDFNLLSTALLPHGKSWFTREMIVASIDHALWFHRDVRVDDWLLYSMDAPTSQGARGFSRGLVYDRAGRLVCSVTQESLMRHVTPPPA